MSTYSTTDNALAVPLSTEPDRLRGVLLIEPDEARRQQVVRGLAALGHRTESFASVDEALASAPEPWALVLVGPTVPEPERARLSHELTAPGVAPPPVRSLGPVYAEATAGPLATAELDEAAELARDRRLAASNTDEFKVELLRWAADKGPIVLRPVLCPDAVLGHAYPQLERHAEMRSGDSIRLLEDLADFGVLSRRLVNRIHICPTCRRWTINFRETCPTCASLNVNVEDLIHHFACAYVGLDSEFRQGVDFRCPKCGKGLTHIGLDYERPRQTYGCYDCHALFEAPDVTAQCLDCHWEGKGADALAWPIYEYEVTDRGYEAIDRGELRGLKLREMIRNDRCALASREFLELEIEREVFRLRRYGRPLALAICHFVVDGLHFPLFRGTNPTVVQEFSRLVMQEVRSLDVAALVDATAIAILLPETGEEQAEQALVRLRAKFDPFELLSSAGDPVDRRWCHRAWTKQSTEADEVLQWFHQGLDSQLDPA